MTGRVGKAFAVVVLALLTGPATSAQSEVSDSCSAHANDRVPSFRIGKRHRLDDGYEMTVSLAPKDVTQGNLVSVGCKLGKKCRSKKFLVVWFFDNRRAAEVWELQMEVGDRATNLALRGSYGFDRERGDQSVTWFYDQQDHDRRVKVNLGQPPPS